MVRARRAPRPPAGARRAAPLEAMMPRGDGLAAKRALAVAALAALLAGPAAAQSDPFQSAPVAAPPKPAAVPRPRPPRREPEAEPAPAPLPVAPAPRPAPVPASFVGTWQGRIFQFPFTLVVEADSGQAVTVQWQGSRIVAGRA